MHRGDPFPKEGMCAPRPRSMKPSEWAGVREEQRYENEAGDRTVDHEG